nr:PA2778 family cysteine peptidase [Pseudomonas resinovorans]
MISHRSRLPTASVAVPVLSRLFRPLIVAACVAVLAGCAAEPLSPKLRAGPERVELSGVPFFAQNAYQSAPASMAALLTQQGEVVTPGMIEKELQLPQKEDALREGLAASARQRGLLVYPLGDDLDELLEQVAAGNPVLVHLREGIGLMPSWRYALLIGYDRTNQQVLLRKGHQRRAAMSFSAFESDWEEAGSWAVLVQAPNQLPASVERARWLRAADDLDAAGQANAAKMARLQMR